MKRAVAYYRVSSKEQEEGGFSLEAQERLLRQYSRDKGIEIVREFKESESAKASGRLGFSRMMEYLRDHNDVRAILVEKTDRLYRNFRDYIFLEDLEVEIHLVKEGEILSKDSRSHAKFIHGIKVLMAKNYIDNLSEEVKKGMREKAEHGEWPARAPIGYLNNKETHLVELDPVKGPLVGRLFQLYARGSFSLKRLRDVIHSEGLRSMTGKRLSISMIEMILKNPFYYGEFVWKDTIYPGIHEPLISRELFDAVQLILSAPGKPRQRKHDFLLKGLVKCARCGCAIVAERKKGTYIYYHCTGARGKCDQPYVREEVLDEQLASILLDISLDQDSVDWIVEALRSSHQDEQAYRESEAKRLKQRYQDLQERLDKSYEDRLDGVIDIGYWSDVSAKWRAEQDAVQSRMERLTGAHRDYVDNGVRVLELAQRAHSLYVAQNSIEKRKVLDLVLSNCTLDGVTLCPTYRKPFDLIAEGRQNQTKLPRLDSNQRPTD